MNKNRLVYFILFASFLLSACAGSPENDLEINNSNTEVVEEPDIVLQDTAVPTPEPTETPDPSPTPVPLVDPLGNEGFRHFVFLSPDSEVSYTVSETFFAEALSKIRMEVGDKVTVGKTTQIEGEFYINTQDDQSEIGGSLIRVEMNSLETESSMRDNWLRDQRLKTRVPIYRYSQFVITDINNFPDQINDGETFEFQLIGDMTILDVTLELIFDVTAKINGNLLSGQATTDLLMADFGIDPPDILNVVRVQDGVLLTITFVAEEK